MRKFTIVPEPRVILTGLSGAFMVPKACQGKSSLQIAGELLEGGQWVKERFQFDLEYAGIDEFIRTCGSSPSEDFDRKEGYMLATRAGRAVIGADTEKGRFYAVQTLAQILATAEGEKVPELLIVDWPRLRLRCFHICYAMIHEDMPYLAPNFELLACLIREYAHIKMNAVLLELEGMFPCRKYPMLSSRFAFTPGQIQELRRLCEENHIEVIPMAQAIGHVYFALRHPEFAHLRELPDTTQQYCTCKQEAKDFYLELVDEILEDFGNPRYFHMGGDEARRLGKCPACREKLEREGMGSLYGDHMNTLGRYFLEKNITPVVWSDIAEKHPEIMTSLDRHFAMAYWNYSIVEWSHPYALEMLAQGGRTVIGCSAAKWGYHDESMFLYKKCMRTIGIMAFECARNGLEGMLITDWMKLTPSEVSIIAVAYGAETSWGGQPRQKEFCRRFSKLFFGLEMERLDELFDLVSELSYRAEDANCYGGVIPYNEPYIGIPADYLDRLDLSGYSFAHALLVHTSQENSPGVLEKLRRAKLRSEEALRLVDGTAAVSCSSTGFLMSSGWPRNCRAWRRNGRGCASSPVIPCCPGPLKNPLPERLTSSWLRRPANI